MVQPIVVVTDSPGRQAVEAIANPPGTSRIFMTKELLPAT